MCVLPEYATCYRDARPESDLFNNAVVRLYDQPKSSPFLFRAAVRLISQFTALSKVARSYYNNILGVHIWSKCFQVQ